MKEFFTNLVEKAKENKTLLIKVSAVLVGAVVGGVIASAIANSQEDYELTEEELLGLDSVEEDDDETESEEEDE